jgi:S-adenosylmethionine:tRNA ribosyltransferase-isomerase
LLIERILEPGLALAHLRASKSPKPGTRLLLDGGFKCRVIERQNDFFVLEFLDGVSVEEVLAAVGHLPLPPYIERPDGEEDRERYQTVFARSTGAVAAPTAGLHFDAGMLERLADNGIEHVFVTLHVGSGTFLPVRVDNLDEHRMHAEVCDVPETTVRRIEAARARGGRIIAIGTTVVRSLETAARSGQLMPYQGETRLFIRPGFHFHCVDALLTNFHLPGSSLLMMIASRIGDLSFTLEAYREAIRNRYRFYSYGDAMLIMDE